MTLPVSPNAISLLDVRGELGLSGTISLNDTSVRNLAGIGSGTISLGSLHGKSNLVYVGDINLAGYPANDITSRTFSLQFYSDGSTIVSSSLVDLYIGAAGTTTSWCPGASGTWYARITNLVYAGGPYTGTKGGSMGAGWGTVGSPSTISATGWSDIGSGFGTSFTCTVEFSQSASGPASRYMTVSMTNEGNI